MAAAAAAAVACPMHSLPALRLETAASSAVTTAATLSSTTIFPAAITPATPSLRAEPTSFFGAFAGPSRHSASSWCSSHHRQSSSYCSVIPNSSDADVSTVATWHSWRTGATSRWARSAALGGAHRGHGRTWVTVTGASSPLGRHGGDSSKCDNSKRSPARSRGKSPAFRVSRSDDASNHGKRYGADPARAESRLTTSALSSPSGSRPITLSQSSVHLSPSKKAPSAAEPPSVATGAAAAGVASADLSTPTSPIPSSFHASLEASFEASSSAALPLTMPHLAAPLDLGPHAHRQTRFAVALAAQLSLFAVLALLQPVSALALAQSARGTTSARTSSRRSSASAFASASASANATLALLPTCPATWHEKDAAAAAVGDLGRFKTAKGFSARATTKHHGSRRPVAVAKAAAVDAQMRTTGGAVAGAAVAETFAALAGDDWVPQNGNGAARGSSSGNGRGAWGVRGGDAAGGRGDWQAVSLAEAREMAEPPFRVAAPGQRIVAIGDVHGDWQQTLAALRIAGVLNDKDGVSDEDLWTGGSTVLVQVGDVLDRGDDEIAILSLLRHLDRLAQRHGGGVLMLNGNHETMNVAEEFRYVSDGGFEESEDFYSFCLSECGGDWESAFSVWWQASQEMKATKRRRKGPWNGWNPIQGQRQVRERHELFEVGGPLAAELARNSAALMINDTLFAHGGILPHHVEYGLPRMNRELSQWMRGDEVWGEGERSPMPFIVTRGFNSVVWTRLYSQEYLGSGEDKYKICTVLAASLDAVGAKRLVVGHTPQVGGPTASVAVECGASM
ncbi:hypothetical protein CLOM_g14815 [Closterium sp. NIES-68]|nr:hypothetical protein CLOM_g14815 [Closterium sp. NIES-68]